MLDWIKKQGIGSYLSVGAAVLTLIAMIIYIVNSTTGYYAGGSPDGVVVAFSVIAILLLAALVATNGKAPHWAASLVIVAVVVLLSVCLANFISGRTDPAADEWFIPETSADPSRGECLNTAIAGAVFYVLAILATMVVAFIGKFDRVKAAA